MNDNRTYSSALVSAPSHGAIVAIDLEAEVRRISELAIDAESANSRRAFESDMRLWGRFCRARGHDPKQPIDTAVAAFLVHLEQEQGKRASSIKRALASCNKLHRGLGITSLKPSDSPLTRSTIRAIVRRSASLGASQAQERRGEAKGKGRRQARAVTAEMIRHSLDDQSVSLRDRALLAIGFASGMRRSELVALTWADVDETPDGVLIQIRASKTDQEGRGATLAFAWGPTPSRCPARLLLQLRASRDDGERVFGCSVSTVNRIVKRCVERFGLEPAGYSAHSLRAGMITHAARAGVSVAEIKANSRHRSDEMVGVYTRTATAFENAAMRSVVEGLGS